MMGFHFTDNGTYLELLGCFVCHELRDYEGSRVMADYQFGRKEMMKLTELHVPTSKKIQAIK